MENNQNWKKTFNTILILAVCFGIFSAIKIDSLNIFLDISFGISIFFLSTFAISSAFIEPTG